MRGYLLVVHNKSLKCKIVQKITKSYFDHIGIFEDAETIIEANLTGVKRTSFKEIQDKAKKNKLEYRIYRIKDITEEQTEIVLNFIEQQVGKKYDLIQLLSIGIMYLLHIARRRPAFDIKQRWICSELIAEGVYEAGLKFSDRFTTDSITPSEIAESPIVELVTQ